MNYRHAVRISAVLVIAGLLSGCAALTVSVDVYKGPLANHEHVLTEQTAVMAIGAKPLLKQLRCELLRSGPEGNADAAGDQKGNRVQWDSDCGVDLKKVPWERKEQAKRVEAVSTLYEDQLDNVPGLQKYFSVAYMKQEEFERALNTLRGQRKEEEKLWERVKPRRENESAQVRQLFQYFSIESEKQQDVKAKRNKLIDDVKNFMVIPENDDYRRVRNLLHSYVQLDRLILPLVYEGTLPSPPPYDGQTTTAYALLAQEEVQRHLTRILFASEDSDRAKAFMNHLAIIASSFLDTRQALRDLWIESIQFLGFLNDPPTSDNDPQWLEDIEAGMPGLTLALAPFIAALTDVQDIAVTICLRDSAATECSSGGPGSSPHENDISTLRGYLVDQSRPEVWTICPRGGGCDFKTDWDRSRLREARQALEFAIIARPKEMLDLLLRSDEIFRRIPYTEFEQRLPANDDASVQLEIGRIGYALFQQNTEYKQGDYRWEYYCQEDIGKSMKAACQKTRDFGIAEIRRRGLTTLQGNSATEHHEGRGKPAGSVLVGEGFPKGLTP